MNKTILSTSIVLIMLCVLIGCSPVHGEDTAPSSDEGQNKDMPKQTETPEDTVNNPTQQYFASLTTPGAPTENLLESEPDVLVDWFVLLEQWTQEVLLVPKQLDELGIAVDSAVRDLVKRELAHYYTSEQSEHFLETFWVETSDENETRYRLIATEGPAVLPFMTTVTLEEVSEEHVAIHATNPKPGMWQDITRFYGLSRDMETQTFRIEDIKHEGY